MIPFELARDGSRRPERHDVGSLRVSQSQPVEPGVRVSLRGDGILRSIVVVDERNRLTYYDG